MAVKEEHGAVYGMGTTENYLPEWAYLVLLDLSKR